MDSQTYQIEAKRTVPAVYPAMENLNKKQQDLINGLMIVMSETGELADTIKKHFFYEKDLDIINIKEELGDLFWGAALIANSCDLNFWEIMQENIDKLRKRYPEKFTSELAGRRLDKVEPIRFNCAVCGGNHLTVDCEEQGDGPHKMHADKHNP